MARNAFKSRRPEARPAKPPFRWPSVRWDAVAAAFSLVLMLWMITEGEWSLYATSGHLEAFYDAQAESLLAGRIDVPPDAIRYEAFMRGGKAYGYFGPTPALMRIPLAVLFPAMKGHWSRSSMLAASVVMLAALWLLLRILETLLPELRGQRLWTMLRPVIILAAAIGSTHYYILSESKVYQESTVWASALSLAHIASLAWYLAGRRGRWLALACVTAFLAFFARVSSGAGPLFGLLLVDLAIILPIQPLRAYWAVEPPFPRRRDLAVLSLTLLVSAGLWACVNYWKFGVWLTSQPHATNLNYSAERLAAAKGELTSLHNLPLTLFAYFTPTHIEFSRRFPWVFGVVLDRAGLAARFPNAHLDLTHVAAALPATSPAWFLAALAGTALVLSSRGSRLRTLRAPICGGLAGCGLVLCWGYITERYLHDLFPWLVAAGVIAVGWAAATLPLRARNAVAASFAILTAYAMWANFALAFTQQRWHANPIPVDRHMAALDLMAVDRGFGGLIDYAARWRSYIPADSFVAGNLALDFQVIPDRGNQAGVRSEGPPPHGARYLVQVPADGWYELAIRQASAEPRPVMLLIDGQAAGQACAAATGGNTAAFLAWSPAGRHRLRRGLVTIELFSQREFPLIHVLRLVRVD